MKINNFSVLGWMHFTPGTYYKFVALVRMLRWLWEANAYI